MTSLMTQIASYAVPAVRAPSSSAATGRGRVGGWMLSAARAGGEALIVCAAAGALVAGALLLR